MRTESAVYGWRILFSTELGQSVHAFGRNFLCRGFVVPGCKRSGGRTSNLTASFDPVCRDVEFCKAMIMRLPNYANSPFLRASLGQFGHFVIVTNMEKDTALARLEAAGLSIKSADRNGNETGWQIRLTSGAIVNCYDNGNVIFRAEIRIPHGPHSAQKPGSPLPVLRNRAPPGPLDQKCS